MPGAEWDKMQLEAWENIDLSEMADVYRKKIDMDVIDYVSGRAKILDRITELSSKIKELQGDDTTVLCNESIIKMMKGEE